MVERVDTGHKSPGTHRKIHRSPLMVTNERKTHSPSSYLETTTPPRKISRRKAIPLIGISGLITINGILLGKELLTNTSTLPSRQVAKISNEGIPPVIEEDGHIPLSEGLDFIQKDALSLIVPTLQMEQYAKEKRWSQWTMTIKNDNPTRQATLSFDEYSPEKYSRVQAESLSIRGKEHTRMFLFPSPPQPLEIIINSPQMQHPEEVIRAFLVPNAIELKNESTEDISITSEINHARITAISEKAEAILTHFPGKRPDIFMYRPHAYFDPKNEVRLQNVHDNTILLSTDLLDVSEDIFQANLHYVFTQYIFQQIPHLHGFTKAKDAVLELTTRINSIPELWEKPTFLDRKKNIPDMQLAEYIFDPNTYSPTLPFIQQDMKMQTPDTIAAGFSTLLQTFTNEYFNRIQILSPFYSLEETGTYAIRDAPQFIMYSALQSVFSINNELYIELFPHVGRTPDDNISYKGAVFMHKDFSIFPPQ